jgi:predicted RNA-binding Zn-ribbon protein involved in translation (DUF1610 family)
MKLQFHISHEQEKGRRVMPLVAAKCTSCDSNLAVDAAKDAAICEYCGTAFITEKAINNYNTVNQIYAQNVNVYGDVNGAERRSAELSRLIANLQQHAAFGDRDNVWKAGTTLTKEYPSDYRAWWEYAKAMLVLLKKSIADNGVINITGYTNFINANELFKTYNNALTVADQDAKKEIAAEWYAWWEGLFDSVLKGTVRMVGVAVDNAGLMKPFNVFPTFRRIFDTGVANANALTQNGIGVEVYYGDGALFTTGKWVNLNRHIKKSAQVDYAYGGSICIRGVGGISSGGLSKFPFTLVDQSVINSLKGEISKYEQELHDRQVKYVKERKEYLTNQYISRGYCPSCMRRLESKRRCKGCGWSQKKWTEQLIEKML